MNEELRFTPEEQQLLNRCLPHLDEDQKKCFMKKRGSMDHNYRWPKMPTKKYCQFW